MPAKYSTSNNFFLILTLLSISACGIEYRYDSASGLCKNKKGEVGYNTAALTECAKITEKDKNFDTKKVSPGTNLNGLLAINADLYAVNLEEADLTGASFNGTTELWNASLKSANLSDTRFFIKSTNMPPVYNISSITINQNTVFPIGYLSGPDNSINLTNFGISVVQNLKTSFQGAQLPSEFSGKISSSLNASHRSLVTNDLYKLKSNYNHLLVQTQTGAQSATEYVNSQVSFWGSHYSQVGTVAFNATLPLFYNTLFRNIEKRTDDLFQSAKALKTWKTSVGKSSKTPIFFEKTVSFFDPPSNESSDFTKLTISAASAEQSPQIVINGEGILLNSVQRGGIAAFSNSYMGMETPQLSRIATIIHESKHSECRISTEMLSAYTDVLKRISELKQKVAASEKTPSFLSSEFSQPLSELQTQIETLERNFDFETIPNPGNTHCPLADCGYTHIHCPSDHPDFALRGLRGACDDSINGAYTLGGSFLLSLISNCKDCKPSDLEIARISAADSFNRYIGETNKKAVRNRGQGLFSSSFPDVKFD